ncbi:hypothetical protein R3P38DRAFT_2813600 [Favolaschia claudopus]|uniref:Uncharacterized protein n=1 Tax=Favolaschia claudopus TaxID=2862362 RepID=A0AAV9Z5B2_9AGAR
MYIATSTQLSTSIPVNLVATARDSAIFKIPRKSANCICDFDWSAAECDTCLESRGKIHTARAKFDYAFQLLDGRRPADHRYATQRGFSSSADSNLKGGGIIVSTTAGLLVKQRRCTYAPRTLSTLPPQLVLGDEDPYPFRCRRLNHSFYVANEIPTSRCDKDDDLPPRNVNALLVLTIFNPLLQPKPKRRVSAVILAENALPAHENELGLETAHLLHRRSKFNGNTPIKACSWSKTISVDDLE